MQLRKTILAALMLVPLAGCVTSGSTPSATVPQLPVVPADIQACFQASGVTIPARALTAGEVEALWGTDRVRIVILKNCGKRFVAWYDSLRESR